MLKIKDNIDLKELEKFGFVYNGYLDCWDFKSNFEENAGLTTYNMIHIFLQEREIYCSMYIGCNERHDTTRGFNIDNILFDLISAGLVERVGD